MSEKSSRRTDGSLAPSATDRARQEGREAYYDMTVDYDTGNPYDEETEAELHAAWYAGFADSIKAEDGE